MGSTVFAGASPWRALLKPSSRPSEARAGTQGRTHTPFARVESSIHGSRISANALSGMTWESAQARFIPLRPIRATISPKQERGGWIHCPLIAVGAQPCLVGCRCSRVAAGCVSYQFGRVRIVDDRPRVRPWFGILRGRGPARREHMNAHGPAARAPRISSPLGSHRAALKLCTDTQ